MANHPNRSKKKIREAQERLQPLIDQLRELGARCMEQTIDPEFGMICERWLLPNGKSVVVYGSPDWRDLYLQASPFTNDWDSMFTALREFSAPKAAA